MSSRSPSDRRGHRRRSRSPQRHRDHRHQDHSHKHKHSHRDRHSEKGNKHERDVKPIVKTERERGYADERTDIQEGRRPERDRHHRHRDIKQEEPIHSRPVKQESRDSEFQRAAEGVQRDNDRERRKHNRRREAHREAEDQDWGHQTGENEPAPDKEKPNFGLSGKLTEDTNTYKGVVIKYNEPEEARKPLRKWRLYPFKGDQTLPMLPIHRQSAYLFGRDRRVADIPVDHPSCSKQHAVFQYRLVGYETEGGRKGHTVKPYIIDLGSANGTFVNNKPIESQRYVELFEKDVLKFGFSSREYVLLHDNVDVSEVVSD